MKVRLESSNTVFFMNLQKAKQEKENERVQLVTMYSTETIKEENRNPHSLTKQIIQMCQ